MSWRADERAVREFGQILAIANVRNQLRARRILSRPFFCADADDLALDVLTAATANSLAAVIMVRVSERNFHILVQSNEVPHLDMPIPDEMTIGEYAEHLRKHRETWQFESDGELVVSS